MRTTMKRVGAILVVVAIFVGTLVLTAPLDTIVRRILTHMPLANLEVTFETSRLGWRGLTLLGVEATQGERVVARLPWVTLRPSPWGLLRHGTGYPVSVTGSLCEGWLDGVIDGDATDVHVQATWVDVDLEACSDAWGIPGRLTGAAEGRIDLVTMRDGGPSGYGMLRIHASRWEIPGVPKHAPTEADVGHVEWQVGNDVFSVSAAEIRNDELNATAQGTVTLTDPLAESLLGLLVTVTPRPTMPQGHRDLLLALPGGPPDRRGQRRFALGGTLGHPVIERPHG
jgi:type II secretion system protein N